MNRSNHILSTLAATLAIGFASQAGAEESKFEKDRAAILAMAGEYAVTFDFKEVEAVAPGYELRKPYHETATEMVEVVEDTGERIVLQHILVIGDDKGGDPLVVKHWRQDWTYQDTRIFGYKGGDTWDVTTLDASEVVGTWSQAVYHVDDSPRYESYGAWEHSGDRSTWRSQPTWRPLPRREYTKRSDYDVIVAVNIHTVTPDGWLHEQENDKYVIGEDKTLAREHGLNTYTRVTDGDFAAGRQYWAQTRDFWNRVRTAWDDVLATRDSVTISDDVDGDSLSDAIDGMVYASADEQREVPTVLASFLVN